MSFLTKQGISVLAYPIHFHIDTRQSPIYLYLMTSADQSFQRKLQAIADPTRRRILVALKERGANSLGKDTGLCASDIEERISLTQPTISHHMAILTKAELVETRKLGQWMWYRRNELVISGFIKILKKSL